MGMHEREIQNATDLHLGTPLGGYRPLSYILESSFPGQYFHRRYYSSILNRLKVIYSFKADNT